MCRLIYSIYSLHSMLKKKKKITSYCSQNNSRFTLNANYKSAPQHSLKQYLGLQSLICVKH